MRAGDRADDVEMGFGLGHPGSQRLVHGVFQGARPGGHRHHRGAQQAHPVDIGFLPAHILGAHVNLAFHAKQGAGGGRRHTMLAGAGFGDDFGFAHAPGKQGLAHHIVDFVGAGMVQLVALQIQLGTAIVGAQTGGQEERAGPADVMLFVVFELVDKSGVPLGGGVGFLHLKDQWHQRFGDKAPAEYSEMSALVGAIAISVEGCAHGLCIRLISAPERG